MDRSERVRRFIDDELDAQQRTVLLRDVETDPQLANELRVAQTLRADLIRLRQTQAAPPADQLQRIMQRAVARREQHDASPTRWLTGLWSPRFRFSLGGIALLSGGVALLTIALLGGFQVKSVPRSVEPHASPSASVVAAEAERRIAVRFMLPASGAKSVAVVGDFNAWQTDATQLNDADGDGVFAATLLLPRGSYGYMFVVDGERWTTDPHATNYRDDGFGQRNAVIRVN